MNSRTHIIKSNEADTLFSGYSDEKNEDRSSIEVVNSGNLQDAIKEYEKALEHMSPHIYKPTSVLTPYEIESLSQILVTKETNKMSFHLGVFISRILQNSYDHGIHHFTLNFPDHNLNYLGLGLKGTLENPLNLYINGNLGHSCAKGSEYLEMIVNGSVGTSFALDSKFLTSEISGDAQHRIAKNAENLNLTIYGGVSLEAGRYSEDSVIKTPNEKTALAFTRWVYNNELNLKSKRKKLMREPKKIDKNNKVYLIEENSNELLLVGFDYMTFGLKKIK